MMRRNWSSFVAKNCRSSGFFLQSRRGFSSTASPEEGHWDWVRPVMFLSFLAGIDGYIIDDVVNYKKSRKKLRKIEEECDYFHQVFMEKQVEYRKRSKEIFGTN
ncbi:unnamed protein product [Microthlaspi erraticum]|uniref:Uncharacterized protein n=1 Tax=Microthlaspi erraticum TaxID=1685480 RepID=A0A6D2I7X2_9BRAS|nr:unnamed protein product [Microthlaspi erraticum]